VSDHAPRVLIVEDNRDTAALLRDLLEAEGYQVVSLGTGEAVFERLEESPDVDLLVLDLMLPGMSGYEVIERLRAEARFARIPILVLSALSSTSARVRGLRDGADDYMTKPFLPEELVARARTLVTSRLLERRTREIEALDQIAQASLQAADVDMLLRRVVEIAAEVVEADGATVLLVDEARGELRARAAVGMEDDLDALSMPLGAGLSGLALQRRTPLLISDGMSSDLRIPGPAIRRRGFRSLMAVPLIVGGAPIGVIEVVRRRRWIDPRGDRLLRIVADRAAIAIEHARLQGEARELADVVRRVDEGVVVADLEDNVTFANRAFLEMVGASSESVTGRRWTEFLATGQDLGVLSAHLRQPGFEGELLVLARGGEPRPVHLTLSTVERSGGGLQRIGVFRDLSREHELRFRVIREQKFRTLGSLAAGVAHNINNRLTPVLGWTEMLLERLAAGERIEPSELTHALQVIHQGASDSRNTRDPRGCAGRRPCSYARSWSSSWR
jgi:PAS domain S-box-containing protein